MNDISAMAGILAQDERVIHEVIVKYSRLLWPIACAVLKNVGSEQDAEECVADAFIELWEHPLLYDPQRGSLKNWLCIVVRCKAIDRYRTLTRHITLPLEDTVPAERMGLPEALLRKEARKELAAALEELSDTQRDILLRRYYYQQKPREIARALDLSVKQVENSLYRAKKKLRHTISAP